jgi:hypothetical protein
MLRKNELYSLLVQKGVSSETTQVLLTQEKGKKTNVEAMSKQNILRSIRNKVFSEAKRRIKTTQPLKLNGA